MKKIVLLLALTVCVGSFTSCTDSEIIEKEIKSVNPDDDGTIDTSEPQETGGA